MANRWFTQFIGSLQKAPVFLWAKVAIGATGAPTLDAVNSKGIKSIARTGTGAYTITFGVGNAVDIYPRLLLVSHRVINATAPAAPLMYVVSQAVSSAGTLAIQFTNSSGTATDPGSGEDLRLAFELTNSTAQ